MEIWGVSTKDLGPATGGIGILEGPVSENGMFSQAEVDSQTVVRSRSRS